MMDTLRDRATDDRTLLAIAAGLVAALLAGAAWAAFVLLTDYEIGWLAWGIGALVGLAMTRTTIERSRGLALAAALCALVGLAAGKGFVTAGSSGQIASEIAASDEYMAGVVAWQLYDDRRLEQATLEALDAAQQAGDTLSDALWVEMQQQGAAALATLDGDQRRAIAEQVASGFVREMGFLGGIRAQLSPFDALWLILAMSTAFAMMNAPKTAPAPAGTGAPVGTEAEARERELAGTPLS